jgi:hypothetical protein
LKQNADRKTSIAGAPRWAIPTRSFTLRGTISKGGWSPRIPTAISFLRQLEKTSPQLARFNIAKMKYLVGDDSLKDDIRIDCEAGFGPALYLMAGNSYRKGSQTDLAEALSYFEAAARNGHLLSRIWAWRLSRRGFWHRVATSISLLPMIVQIIVVMMRNEKDVRVWH